MSTPGDLAAVIHTNHGRSQNFTADWALLKAAIGQAAVPDFAREPVPLSGVVLHDPQVIHLTPASVFGDLPPEPPMIRRVFSADEEVTALVRVSQRRSDPPPPSMFLSES